MLKRRCRETLDGERRSKEEIFGVLAISLQLMLDRMALLMIFEMMMLLRYGYVLWKESGNGTLG
jgi:hypothetical protein